ncbi:zinc ribbon domain-containing protein [Sphingobium fuliginis]|uniref:zinc ribbon domain-containing protein n=1 Tax=Sphingobium fuliginis (strain ATCC 27551) TaxID=336203 RepID=UPI000C082996|nr:zinc ribbon domain-containing protein [Sphingobium fuliginis]
MNADETTCPDCAETIKAAAKVCKHCGYRFQSTALEGKEPEPTLPTEGGAATAEDNAKWGGNPVGALIFGGLAVAFIVAAVIKFSSGPMEQAQSINESVEAAMNASNAADAAMNDAMAAADAAMNIKASVSSADLARVCRAAVAHMMGKSPSIMKVVSNRGGIVRIQYKRPDDGTIWKDDCRLEGQRVMWRSVDAFGASGAGRWRNDPNDEVITYSIDGSTIRIGQKYSDGTYDAADYTVAG